MPNILQLQKELESLPDERLIQEVNSPSMYPSYLSTQEAQRREQLRNAYKSRVSQMPQNTVKDQLVQRLMSGIGSIPQNVPNGPMPNEMMTQMQAPMQPPMGMYAGGGIVGYQTGGEVDPDPPRRLDDTQITLTSPPESEWRQRLSTAAPYALMLSSFVPSLRLKGAGGLLAALTAGGFWPTVSRVGRTAAFTGGAGLAIQDLLNREEEPEQTPYGFPPLVIPDTSGMESPYGLSQIDQLIADSLKNRREISAAEQARLDMLEAQRGAAAEDEAERLRVLNSLRASKEDLARREQELTESEIQRIQSYMDPEAEDRERRATMLMAVSRALSGKDIASGLAEGIPDLIDLGKEQRRARQQIDEQVRLLNREKLRSAQNLQNFIDDIEVRVAEGRISRRQAEREIDSQISATRMEIENRQNNISDMITLYGAQTQRMAVEAERPSTGERRQQLYNLLQLNKKDPIQGTANIIRSAVEMYLNTGSDRDIDAIKRVVISALRAGSFPIDQQVQVLNMVFPQATPQATSQDGFADGGLYTGKITNMIPQP